ncbi:MAG: DUF4388 domain-containing protein [Polyangia bacterium]
MRAPSVVIIASPYEGELIGRALAETGLRVLRADGGEGGHALLATELPLAMVLGTSLFGADPVALVADARARDRYMSIYLLADEDDAVASMLAPQVNTILRRPADFEALAHTIEQLAVDAEKVEVDDIISSEPVLLPRVPTQPVSQDPLVRVGVPMLDESVTTSPRGEASLLRADDALAGLGLDEVISSTPLPSFDNRSTIARAIDRELSQAERRLFPGEAATPLPFGEGFDYDDALGDIDLDSLGIETIAGPRGPTRSRTAEPMASRPVETPSRPIQEEGSLETLDVAELIGRLHAAAFSGALQLHRPEGEKILYFDHGDPVGGRSTLKHDHLGELLFREGKLTRDQAARVRTAVEPGALDAGLARPVALRLVEEGLLKESELFAAARRHLEELFFSCFSLQSGEYRLGPELPLSDDRVRASTTTRALVLEGVRRKYGLERLATLLGGRDAVLAPTTSFPNVVETAALGTDERRVAVLFDGHRSLGDIRAALGHHVAESLVFGVAWGLAVVGALEHNGAPADLRSASTVVTLDPGAERRARPRTVDAAQRTAERGIERDRIAVKRAQILDADYFTILGVDRDATDHELHAAHARLRADFESAQFDEETRLEQAAALAEINEVLDEALRVLMVPHVRTAYAAHVVDVVEQS